MIPSFVIPEIVTPKKVLLKGLWFGPRKPKRAIVWVHGLGSSAFSMLDVVRSVADPGTAVITFNNRGHGHVSSVRKRAGKNIQRLGAGSVHEVFTDCVDDIQGAINFVRKRGIKDIYLAGHSTGCQKSIYWAYKKKGRGTKGIILLAPVSDWSAEKKRQGAKKIARAVRAARTLVHAGKKHALLPEGLWHEMLDAQRFLSLYTPDSIEEIFSYAQQKKNPKILQSVRVPVLVLWGEREEFSGRSSEEVLAWFEKNLRVKHRVIIVPGAGHGFHAAERMVARHIREFMKYYCGYHVLMGSRQRSVIM